MSFRKTLTKVRVVTRDKTYDFDNFQDALFNYPELNMYRGSKNFTSAIEDGEYIRFELWEIHNALNED